MSARNITVDGNEAVALVAHLVSEVVALYPITPSSPMGEFVDAWAASQKKNIFGTVPQVIEMQSEGGAAGACHGALQAGALTTTFTASQGLLLMIPDMYKIAGELTSAVFHVAARSVATHALSIFGDHSDVMATRQTGWALLASANVQEAHDFALIAQMATLDTRIPFLHFFDGFRTSHEVAKIDELQVEDVKALVDLAKVREHRKRSLNPDRPVLRGSAQNPDVFFQAREAINPYYDRASDLVQRAMDRFAERTGRQYARFEYVGHPEAERVVVLMGSGCGAAHEAIEARAAAGEKVGLIKVRLYRPFDTEAFVATLPKSVEKLSVLDRTKEPGAVGEPLYQDVITALSESWDFSRPMPRVVGGRYGLSSKEFTPAMVVAILDELEAPAPKRHFTVGIVDDVTHLSIKHDPEAWNEPKDVTRAVFYGLGSDGTVGANKNSVKIVGEYTPLHAQGYFVYDSKKAGSRTVSHLRFSKKPIQSSYLIEKASFVACHQFQFLEQTDLFAIAERGATFLLNSPFGPDDVWDQLPREAQQAIIDKQLRFFVVDGYKVATEAGLGPRINTVMQTCFFALTDILPTEESIGHIKDAIDKSYGKAGKTVLERNFAAVDGALAALHQVVVPERVTATRGRPSLIPDTAPDFVKRVTAIMMAGQGDLLPVSAMPVDGTFPLGTAKFEKRGIAPSIPIWDPAICIDCALCSLMCPHAAIRMKPYEPAALASAPAGFQSKTWSGKDLPDHRMTIQVAPDDCTGCGICVDVCPAKSKEVAKHKAINMEPRLEHVERERANYDFFLSISDPDRRKVAKDNIKGTQMLEPLFEYSGACAGCGETPYLKLVTQLFGDRMIVANATGCSSIYGGNLPTTPWTVNADGRGPAWSNSLFEDNAEFGLGMRLAVEAQEEYARTLLERLSGSLDTSLVRSLLEPFPRSEEAIAEQRQRVTALRSSLAGRNDSDAIELLEVCDALVPRSVWIVGGDGWAYDIGFGGLDHVLASGRNVNVLVLDTEVYSNTGGQASKSTPRAAVAKFAAAGKEIGKKDLGMIATAYGNVYVARVAIGGNPMQTVRAFLEAESYDGPSLILAYSHCIAHGIDMETAMSHQKDVVGSGYWPLFRFDPRLEGKGAHPFQLDSRAPKKSFAEFARKEARFAMLERVHPERAQVLFAQGQRDIDERWHYYAQMANVERSVGNGSEED